MATDEAYTDNDMILEAIPLQLQVGRALATVSLHTVHDNHNARYCDHLQRVIDCCV